MKLDEINYWSELKLEIIQKYAKAYSTILSAQNRPKLYHIYIDAFAGAGIHFSKRTNDFVLGSPLNALKVVPPFQEFHLIDLDKGKYEYLSKAIGQMDNVHVYNEDCNKILIEKVFPRCLYEDYRRALCLLDPYGLHLSWDVIKKAGEMESLEIFLNFPVMDMNMNVLWSHPDSVDPTQRERMNLFWGDESWRGVAYDSTQNLFGYEEKTGNWDLVKGFQERLKSTAGFKYVPDPIPMRNRNAAIVYYLFFASQKPVAADIVADIFKKYKDKVG